MENINAYEQSNADYQAVQNSSPSGQGVLPAPDFSKPYTYNSETPENAKTPNQSINSASEGVGVSPLVMEKKQGDSFAVPTPRKPTYLDGGLNEGANSTPVELPKTTSEGIEKAFTENIDASKIDVPPALEPFSKAADILEKESSKTDTPESKTAAAEEIMKNANQNLSAENLPLAWWDYIGKGGVIYVHVLNLDMQKHSVEGMQKKDYQYKETGEEFKLTKQHYISAADIANERYKKLDVNLKIVVIFDENAQPLTKEEFIQRKADKDKRKKLPSGFDANYSPMDTYVVIDDAARLQLWQNSLGDLPAEEANRHWSQQISKNTKFEVISKEMDAVVGNCNPEAFLALVNTKNLGEHLNNFIDDDRAKKIEKQGPSDLDRAISEALSCLIEHETAHIKFTEYAENEGRYFSNCKSELKNRSECGKGAGGHIYGSIMAAGPKHAVWASITDPEKIYLGYDIYMQTMLQLLHGHHPENHPDQQNEKEQIVNKNEFFFKKLSELDKQRKKIQEELKEMKSKNILNTPAGVEKQKAFERLDRITAAHFDMLLILNQRRQDVRSFILKKQFQKYKPFIAHPIYGQNTYETAPQD